MNWAHIKNFICFPFILHLVLLYLLFTFIEKKIILLRKWTLVIGNTNVDTGIYLRICNEKRALWSFIIGSISVRFLVVFIPENNCSQMWVSGVCYNEQCYNERMLQRTVFMNKMRMLQRKQMLQRTRRNTIGRRSTRVPMTSGAFPLWLERQSSSLLSFVRFSYQFSSVICLFVQSIKVNRIIIMFNLYFLFYVTFLSV